MILPETVLQDLRCGARLLRRNKGLTAAAIFALALGIGVDATVFVAWKAMVARPVEARDPDAMVSVALLRHSGEADFRFSVPDYESYRESVRSFRPVLADSLERVRLTDAGSAPQQHSADLRSLLGGPGLLPSSARTAEFAAAFIVSEDYFDVLGVQPLRGRSFKSTSLRELTESPAVLISENYWQKRFAGVRSVVGRTVRLNGVAVTIIGIAPHDFVGTNIAAPDFWVPLHVEPLLFPHRNWFHDRGIECCRIFGRLAPGATPRQAEAEMTLVANRLRAVHDGDAETVRPLRAIVWRASPFPLPLDSYPGLRLAILLIAAGAGMVLAIACANAGNVELVRARSRQSELAMRVSLGATRIRLMRQLLTESALFGVIAGTAALFCTWAFTRLLATRFSEALPPDTGTIVFHVTPDLGVVLFVIALSLGASAAFGFLPAMVSSSGARLAAANSRAFTSSVRSRRVQDALVAVQVSASLVLMTFAGMFVRGAMRSISTETGYDSRHVIDVQFEFPESRDYTDARKMALAAELHRRVASLPGVAAITSAAPPSAPAWRVAASTPNVQVFVFATPVQSNYFSTLGIPLLTGRALSDRAGSREAIVSESAAVRLLPGGNPLGHDIRLGKGEYRIVGVARDIRGVNFDGSGSQQVYVPLAEDQAPNYPMLIHTHSDPAPVMRALDSVLPSVDRDLVIRSATLDRMLRESAPFITSSLAAVVASSIGLLALLLAAIGIVGTVSYIVVLRTREVGIRMAIGAQKRDVVFLILRESARPIMAGLGVGLTLAAAAGYLLRGLFYGLNKVDSISLFGASALFLVIALAAAYAPSRRALSIDPITALRME
ncbi:MAG TPA: ABC transporter permease [Bryobacteraceae bacterium]|nr:ABC transporter permease [Bryobacteraceae bacterium]